FFGASKTCFTPLFKTLLQWLARRCRSSPSHQTQLVVSGDPHRHRRPQTGKGDRDSQQVKKKVRDYTMKEKPIQPNAWTERTNTLFEEVRDNGDWYVADSDSEDVAESMREEDDELDEEEEDPLCPQIFFTAAEKASFRRPCRSALVVKGLGRNVPYLPLARRLNFLWAKHGNIQISDLKNGCYLVRFRRQEDYEWAITGGPWMLGDTYLTVHRWFRGFDPWTTKVTTTMVWLELPDLPIEFYNPVAVKRIASRIGKPFRVDRATEEGARGKFARVCVCGSRSVKTAAS
ncbi:hypothetical protein LINGRAPRIM_LOCUS481, partial [Linum grandiflorum]